MTRVDDLVEALWDMGRLDKARDVAAKHLRSAMVASREETVDEVERLFGAMAMTTHHDHFPAAFLAALRELRRTHQ